MEQEAEHHDETGVPELGPELEDRLHSSLSRSESRRSRERACSWWHHQSSIGCRPTATTASSAVPSAEGLLRVSTGSKGDVKRVKSMTKVRSEA